MSKEETLKLLQQNIFCDDINKYFYDEKTINELYFQINQTHGLIHLFKNFDKFKEQDIFLDIYASDLLHQKSRYYAKYSCNFPCFIPTENKSIDKKYKIVDKLISRLCCSKSYYRTFFVKQINYKSSIKNEIIHEINNIKDENILKKIKNLIHESKFN